MKRDHGAALASKVSRPVVQGAWSRLKKEEEADRLWRSMIWGMPSHICRFATQTALDILPTHANLARWRAPVGAACVCGVRDTLAHSLNGCELKLPRFKWRHDSILEKIASSLISKGHNVQVDLPGFPYKLPTFLADQSLRPDIVILADSKIFLLELTVPFEGNFENAHSRKETKYSHLLGLARENGFVPRLLCFEVGSRGLSTSSLTKLVRDFNLGALKKEILSTALRCSYVIWTMRFLRWENPPLLSGDPDPHDV